MHAVSYVEAQPLSPRARRRRILRRRFLRRPAAVLSLAVVVTFVLAAVFARWVAPHSPDATDFDAILASPSREHLLGTDELGRDTLSRVIWGARASIQAGFFATLIAMVIAVPIGLVAGYYRGKLDTVIARLTDVLLAFPFLILAVGLAAILGPSLLNATLALGIAAVPPLIVAATLALATAIIDVAGLGFLGLGPPDPRTPEWGTMLTDSTKFIRQAPWLLLFPGAAIVISAVGFNLLGDGLRESLDPRMRR